MKYNELLKFIMNKAEQVLSIDTNGDKEVEDIKGGAIVILEDILLKIQELDENKSNKR